VSYEVERRLHVRRNEAAENTQEARDSESRLLRLDRRDGRLVGLPLFTLLYPSSVLARIGGKALAAAGSEAGDGPPALGDVLQHAENAVRSTLARVIPEAGEGRPDEAWYWVAPILLDLAEEETTAASWWARADLAWAWTDDEREANAEGWNEHLEHAWTMVQGERPQGPPPHDLVQLLASISIAGPATSALRSLRSVSGYERSDTPIWLRDAGARIGWSYRRLFNQIEPTTLIRGEYREEPRTPYWRQILRYALDGGLTAVNDEYLHVLAEATAARSRDPESASHRIVEAFEEGVALPASRVEWDEIRLDDDGATLNRTRLRTHFAARFGKAESDDGGTTREDQVRAAFNSPFWPFVLASTSVGQEGLDFHPYCHAIVHWNLPGNPVDMEQREGRIHRYKGHAVRKNLAQRFEYVGRTANKGDRWDAMFEQAREEQAGNGRGLVPDWNYPIEGGARIERHVPVLPFSRDARRYERLRKSLAAYRMVFGQARQEDLVAYLLEHVGPERIEGLSGQLRIDLAPSGEHDGS
ncbi:MAG: helicase-related protein, partial [Halofilum sp. (in: g-proteobacteria)]